MSRRLLLAGALVVLSAIGRPAIAQEDVRNKLALQIMEAMDWRKQIQGSVDTLLKVQMGAAMATAKQAGMAEPDAQRMVAMQKEINAVLADGIDWEAVGRESAKVWASVYTEDELRGILAFYQSPAGRAMLAKQMEVMAQTVSVAQPLMMQMMPRILEIFKKYRPQ